MASERPERGDRAVEGGVTEALGVSDGGPGIGEDGGRVKRRLREGAGRVGESPGYSPVAAVDATAGEASHRGGVEAEAERLVPVLLLARRKDERRAAVAAGAVSVDVEVTRDLAAEELAPWVAADRASRKVGPVVGVVRPGGAGHSGSAGAREERDLAKEPMTPGPSRRTATRNGGSRARFHAARKTEWPAPCSERARRYAKDAGLLQTGAGTRPEGAGSAPSFFISATGTGATGSAGWDAWVLAFVACGTSLPVIRSIRV